MFNKIKIYAFLGLVSYAFSVSSCLTPAEQEFDEENQSSQSYKLSVTTKLSSPWSKTRASSESVPLPVRYYLFDSSDLSDCKGLKTINSADTSAEFELEKGDYVVYALCGDVTGAPTESAAAATEFIKLEANSDVCLGHDSISVSSYGIGGTLSIGVEHIFSSISLSISKVPSTVKSISVTFCKLYESISLNGEYSGEEDQKLQLNKPQAGSDVWILPETFLYPSEKSVTSMPINLEVISEDNSTQTIETTTEYILKQGVKNVLTAAFQSLNTVSASVSVNNAWTEVSGTIDFWGTGNSNNQTGSGGSGSDPGNAGNTGSTNLPSYKPGDMFGNTKAFVLESTPSADGLSETLLLVGCVISDTVLESEIKNTLSNYNTTIGYDGDDITWHTPTNEELKQLCNLYNAKEFKNKIREWSPTITLSSNLHPVYYNSGTNSSATIGYNGSSNPINGLILLIPFATYTISKGSL